MIQVSAFPNGEVALQNFEVGKYAAIMSDLKMPKLDGLTLLGEIRELDKKIPFILLTAFMDILDVKAAFQFGVSEVLTKPVKISELAKKLDEVIEKAENRGEDEVENSEAVALNLYKNVPLDMVLDGHFIECDRYLRLKPGKYIVVVQAGEDIDKNRIMHYKDKGVTELYVLESDMQRKLLTDQKEFKQILKRENKVSFDLKAKVVADSSYIAYEALKKDGPGKFVLDHLYNVFSSMSDLQMVPSEVKTLYKALYEKQDNLFSHAVAVGSLSMLMAAKLDVNQKENIVNVGLGGFLHDIGKIKLAETIVKNRPSNLSEEELMELASHPELGRDILEEIPGIPEIILSIVNQHHEYIDGSGYPKSLRKMKISKGAQIVGLANDYTNMTLEDSPQKHLSPREAVDFLEAEYKKRYDLKVFLALKKVLKMS
jgi:putative nucleotidyltransferase with HDIG domain